MKLWVKILAVVLLFYVHIGGFLVNVPDPGGNLDQTIRGVYFHVPMWFGMTGLFAISTYFAIRHLRTSAVEDDVRSVEFANVGIIFGILGLLTGMLWANYTWGSPWTWDPKQNGASVAMLVYLAYFVLRGSLENADQRGKLSAVYNIFAFAAMIPLVFILPRMADSLHPGAEGNPGFNQYDMDGNMRLVFYPAVVGWFLVGLWITNLRVRVKMISEKLDF